MMHRTSPPANLEECRTKKGKRREEGPACNGLTGKMRRHEWKNTQRCLGVQNFRFLRSAWHLRALASWAQRARVRKGMNHTRPCSQTDPWGAKGKVKECKLPGITQTFPLLFPNILKLGILVCVCHVSGHKTPPSLSLSLVSDSEKVRTNC